MQQPTCSSPFTNTLSKQAYSVMNFNNIVCIPDILCETFSLLLCAGLKGHMTHFYYNTCIQIIHVYMCTIHAPGINCLGINLPLMCASFTLSSALFNSTIIYNTEIPDLICMCIWVMVCVLYTGEQNIASEKILDPELLFLVIMKK